MALNTSGVIGTMNDESRPKPRNVTNAAITTTPHTKLDFLCTALKIDEQCMKKCSIENIDWDVIKKDLKEERSKSPAKLLLTFSTAPAKAIENRDDVNAKRHSNSPPNQRPREQQQHHHQAFPKALVERPLPRPPVLPSCLYQHNRLTVKKRFYDDFNNNDASMIHCKGKVYLPSGKSLDVPTKRVFRRCTAGLRMDPLSPPPFTLPKGPVGIPH